MKHYKLKLKETVSDIVYHLTTIPTLWEIFNEDKLELTAKLGTPSDKQFSNKLFYLSLCSVKFGGYGQKFTPNNVANIVFDGRKLSQRYKGSPVDYWGQEYRNSALATPDMYYMYHKNDEEEQRIYSNKPEIAEAHSYIKEVHVCFGDLSITPDAESFYSEFVNSKEYKNINQITETCSLYNIPVYVYADFSAFKTLNKKKAYLAEQRNRISNFTFLQTILKLYNDQKMSEKERSYARDIVRALDHYNRFILENDKVNATTTSSVQDFLRSFQNEIHNLRKESVGKKLVNQVMELFNKHKKNQVEDILEILNTKLKKTYGDNYYNQVPYIPPFFIKD